MSQPSFDICAIGHAIVDIIADVPEDFLRQQKITKGSVTMIDAARIAALRKSVKKARSVRAGGAASNTVAGIASFGGKPAYMGKTAYDEVGRLFNDDLMKLGVRYPTEPAKQDGAATGICLSFVTSGAERTMCTYLGASVDFSEGDIDRGVLCDAQIVYLEGYMLDRPNTAQALQLAADTARAAGRKVALALCDVSCVERNRAAFLELIGARTDIIFANEKELMALYKTFHLDAAVQHVKEHVKTAIVTRSEKGAIILDDMRLLNISAEANAHMVDKTGAGDAFAAGFLFGRARGMDVSICAKLGVLAAAEVISHYGPRPEHSLAAIAKQKGAML